MPLPWKKNSDVCDLGDIDADLFLDIGEIIFVHLIRNGIYPSGHYNAIKRL